MTFERLSDDEILAVLGLRREDIPNLYFVDVIEDGSVIFWLTKPVPANAAWRGSPYLMEEIKDAGFYGVVMFHQQLWWDFYEKKVKALNEESKDEEQR